MAARKSHARKNVLKLSDDWRARIQTSMIINRLQDHIKGAVELSASQVTAALGLLKKTAPDMQSIEHSGEIEHSYIARLPTPPKDINDWQDQHSGLLPHQTPQ